MNSQEDPPTSTAILSNESQMSFLTVQNRFLPVEVSANALVDCIWADVLIEDASHMCGRTAMSPSRIAMQAEIRRRK
jgi:hypothetical protein